jgi:hypothetical protein
MNSTPQKNHLTSDSDAQASIILAVGSALWKLISDISNVDFLLSINGEKFDLFLNFLQGPGWMLLTVIGVVWFIVTVIRRRQADKYRPLRSPSWGLVASSVVVAFLFGILIAINSSGSVPNVLIAWGSALNEQNCAATIDTTRLSSFRKKYKLAIACGATNSTIDHLDDDSIAISNPYTIIPGGVAITVPWRQEMQKKITELIDQGKAKAAAANVPPQVQVQVPVQMWYDPILIPNDIPANKINKLSDLLKFGGKILRQQYFN